MRLQNNSIASDVTSEKKLCERKLHYSDINVAIEKKRKASQNLCENEKVHDFAHAFQYEVKSNLL
ncbi:8719_t:CDS:2 [Paraglomus brasilianum]|uniref:8719_t:CDS:1 n=1 Tax=Paraglomus brasilianum TaxID=144538 RepID=A0A9N9G5Q3_9GLOM|nr:8719_t:CDS:2 [Paraglomus brasilianum]